jgi:hypothetical protein
MAALLEVTSGNGRPLHHEPAPRSRQLSFGNGRLKHMGMALLLWYIDE